MQFNFQNNFTCLVLLVHFPVVCSQASHFYASKLLQLILSLHSLHLNEIHWLYRLHRLFFVMHIVLCVHFRFPRIISQAYMEIKLPTYLQTYIYHILKLHSLFGRTHSFSFTCMLVLYFTKITCNN